MKRYSFLAALSLCAALFCSPAQAHQPVEVKSTLIEQMEDEAISYADTGSFCYLFATIRAVSGNIFIFSSAIYKMDDEWSKSKDEILFDFRERVESQFPGYLAEVSFAKSIIGGFYSVNRAEMNRHYLAESKESKGARVSYLSSN